MSDIFVRKLFEEKVSKIKRPKHFASDLLCMARVPGCAENGALEALCTIRHMVRHKLRWDANHAVGLSKQRKAGLDW